MRASVHHISLKRYHREEVNLVERERMNQDIEVIKARNLVKNWIWDCFNLRWNQKNGLSSSHGNGFRCSGNFDPRPEPRHALASIQYIRWNTLHIVHNKQDTGWGNWFVGEWYTYDQQVQGLNSGSKR